MLRSIRYGEADRILHLFTLANGRVGGIAKGARKTRSRFGARLEPLSPRRACAPRGTRRAAHGHGGASRALARRVPDGPYRMAVGLDRARGGAQALPRGGGAAAGVPCARPLPRPAGRRGGRAARASPALDPLVLSFQLKLLWLSGYLPHLGELRRMRGGKPLVGFSPRGAAAACSRGRVDAEAGSRDPGAARVAAGRREGFGRRSAASE